MTRDFREYVSRFERYRVHGVLETVAMLDEPGGPYPLLSLTIAGRHPMVLTAGFHGEEPAPPLTLLEHLDEIVDHARSLDVGMRIYPCVNPSGFEDRTRYNRTGERPNNDFIRYVADDGAILEQVEVGQSFVSWHLHDVGPKETVAMRKELARHPPPNAALDLHQDRYLDGPHTYAYVFGDRARFDLLVERAARLVPLAQGYKADERRVTDARGLVEHHDGSVSDYFVRRGVKHVACLETTTSTPLEVCHGVNLVWVKGFIELAAKGSVSSS